ncbi:hypothetical protein V8E54_013466 [Elaphomyces granulatus]
MHFLKAISILACAIPIALATNFHNSSPDNITVQDSVGAVVPLNPGQSCIVENGYANITYNTTDGYICGDFVYRWNTALTDVYWNVNATSAGSVSLMDETQTIIPPENRTIECCQNCAVTLSLPLK